MLTRFLVRFKGQCAQCQCPLAPGDAAAFDHDKNVICARCADEHDE